MQKYPYIIESYACILKGFVVIFLFLFNFFNFFWNMFKSKPNQVFCIVRCSFVITICIQAIQRVPIDLISSRFISWTLLKSHFVIGIDLIKEETGLPVATAEKNAKDRKKRRNNLNTKWTQRCTNRGVQLSN